VRWCPGNESRWSLTERAKTSFFPYTPCRLYCTDFKQPHSPSLIMTQPQRSVCVSVCAKTGEGRRRGERRRIPVQGRAAPHPGEAQLERALPRGHVAHLQLCASTLPSAQPRRTSPAYVCSHCRVPSSWDATAASGTSFPERHAATSAKGTRR